METIVKKLLGHHNHIQAKLASKRAMLEVYRDPEVRKQLQLEIGTLERQAYTTEKALDVLEPNERRIIELRYFEGLTWGVISVKSRYSLAHCHRLHRQALRRAAAWIERKCGQD